MKNFLKCVQNGDQKSVQKLLQQNPNLINACNENGLSVLMIALYHGHPKLAKYLSSLKELDIFEAAAVGNTNRLEELIESAPEAIHGYSGDGFQALGLACFFGHYNAARILIEAGAQINFASQNPMQVAPLHSAVAAKHTKIAQLLLENGADVNARQAGAFTPLHAAAQNKQEDMLRLLLEAGAEPLARNAKGETPLDLVRQTGDEELVNLLLESMEEE